MIHLKIAMMTPFHLNINNIYFMKNNYISQNKIVGWQKLFTSLSNIWLNRRAPDAHRSACGTMSLIMQTLENSTIYFWEHKDKKGNSKVKCKFVPEYERKKGQNLKSEFYLPWFIILEPGKKLINYIKILA